jgi:hypothetical protein
VERRGSHMKKAFSNIGLIVLGVVLTMGAQLAFGQPRWPHLRNAMVELREAKNELLGTRHDWGGHRDRAIRALDEAHHQIEEILKYER